MQDGKSMGRRIKMSQNNAKYYDPTTMEPVAQVPTVKGDKMKNVTIREVKAMGLIPRTTSIIELMANFGVVKYKIREAVKACMVIPFEGILEGKTDMQIAQIIKDYEKPVYAKASEHAKNAADEGTLIHKAVYLWLGQQIEPTAPVRAKICDEASRFLKSIDAQELSLERSFGSRELGFAGTPDIWCTADRALLEQELGLVTTCKVGDQRVQVMIDVKSTDMAKFKAPYDSWKLQLGAYRGGTGCDDGTFLVQFVADRAHGDCVWINHEEPDKWWDAFRHLFEIWCILKKYDPRVA